MDSESEENRPEDSRPADGDETDSPPVSKFTALRGIAKEAFAAEGGGEAFLRRERDAFE